MSKVRVEVSGYVILDVEDVNDARDAGHFLKDTLDNIHPDRFHVSAFDFDAGRKVSLERFKAPRVFTGRQESESTVQGMVRMLVQGKFVNSDISNATAAITENSLKLDELTNHYSVDYGKLYDEVLPFAVDADTFAVDFKNVLSDVLINNATRGAAFMKEAKKG